MLKVNVLFDDATVTHNEETYPFSCLTTGFANSAAFRPEYSVDSLDYDVRLKRYDVLEHCLFSYHGVLQAFSLAY